MKLLVLAATKHHNGYCIAGVNTDLEWSRPVVRKRGKRPLKKSHVFEDGHWISKKRNIVRYEAKKYYKYVPHSEDFLFDESKGPKFIKQIDTDDFKKIISELDESKKITNGIKDYLINNRRSLMLVKPNEIECKTRTTDHGRQCRIKFSLNENEYDFTCTNLRWRKFIRDNNLKEGNELLNNRESYFSIGLTREYEGEYWPLVIGVHTFPKFEIEVNHSNL